MARYPVTGRVALVTGAAGGIGLETARSLHQRGASVVLTDLDAQATERAAASIAGERTLGLAADVTDPAALAGAVDAAVDTFGGLDIVVANAGIASVPATARAMDQDHLDRVLAVDLVGVWNTVRAAMPQVIDRRGHMVLVASVYAFMPGMGMTPYAIAKAGVEQLARALRVELRLHRAGATVAYFGFIDTPMVQDSLADPLAERFTELVPAPLRKRLHPRKAGEAIARGIERRSAKVIAPRRWALLQAARGISDPISERYVLGNREMMAVLTELEQRTDEAKTAADMIASADH